MGTHHRKIELQAPDDLEYLTSIITNNAQKKIDLHLPPSAVPADSDDTFRIKVNNDVHEVRAYI